MKWWLFFIPKPEQQKPEQPLPLREQVQKIAHHGLFYALLNRN